MAHDIVQGAINNWEIAAPLYRIISFLPFIREMGSSVNPWKNAKWAVSALRGESAQVGIPGLAGDLSIVIEHPQPVPVGKTRQHVVIAMKVAIAPKTRRDNYDGSQFTKILRSIEGSGIVIVQLDQILNTRWIIGQFAGSSNRA
jgi:hypothetical protein